MRDGRMYGVAACAGCGRRWVDFLLSDFSVACEACGRASEVCWTAARDVADGALVTWREELSWDVGFLAVATLECRSKDGSGCGAVWVEWGLGTMVRWCPGCGRRTFMANVEMNASDHPKAEGLEDDGSMVVFHEEGL